MTSPGRLTRLDEWPRHQLPRTFDTVASDSPHWSDGYYFTLSDQSGSAALFTAIRLYANNDVLDGYACVSTAGRQHNLRWSRRLRPAIDDLRVGPLAVDILDPLARLRTTCAPNPYGISYDLQWTGLHEPYLEDYRERIAGGRVTASRCNYGQCCDVTGWLEVDGQRFEVTANAWAGVRDHSWGIGRTGGPPSPAAAPTGERGTAHGFAVRQWAMVRFPRRIVFWQFHQDSHGGFPMVETRVFPRQAAGGTAESPGDWAYAGPPEVDLSLVPGHRRMRHSTVVFPRPDGGSDRFRVTAVGSPVYLQGGGYFGGFDDGLGRGVYRGDEHSEGEQWDVSDPTSVVDPHARFRARPDAWAEGFAVVENLDDEGERGFGHVECVIAGYHPDLHGAR